MCLVLHESVRDYRADPGLPGRSRRIARLRGCRYRIAEISPFGMSAPVRLAGGCAVLFFLWAAIFWAVLS